jgi:glycosyltransferase involved in cell wall biosynthesis
VKVGLITTGFPRFEGDHSGAFLLAFARRLVAHGHRVRVLAPEPALLRSAPHWPGIEVRWVPYARPRSRQRTFYGHGAPDNLRLHRARWAGAASFAGALLIASRRELEDCDALMSSWCVPSGWVASVVAGGRDHLCICHATDVRWLSRIPGGGALARAIAAGATSMWFLSHSHRDRFFGLAGLDPSARVAHIGPMPIEPPRAPTQTREELRRRLGIHGFTVLFLGRLVPVKGVDQLLRAAAALANPVHLRIAGDGPERDRLRALARDLGVDVTFDGWVRGDRKEALFRACDAIVVPSRGGDGLPTVLFEARSRSVPMIATRAGAVADYIHPNDQIRLVPPDDQPALCRAIGELAARPAAPTA